MGKSMPTTSLSQYLHAFVHNFAEKSLSQTQTNMALRHQRKIVFLRHQFQVIIANLLYGIASDINCKVLSNSGDHLLFLGLIINDWNLFLEGV
jgi:hypothetical protein